MPLPWWKVLWPPARRQHESDNTRRQTQFNDDYRTWEHRKADFDAAEFARQQREEQGVLRQRDDMTLTLQERLEEIDWPRETVIDFDLGSDDTTMALDIDLPSDDDMPDQEWTMPAKALPFVCLAPCLCVCPLFKKRGCLSIVKWSTPSRVVRAISISIASRSLEHSGTVSTLISWRRSIR
ncbi:hypothetical protein HZU72_18480 [Halomonas sp. QX-2]|uniref:Uncharacterized protein n=1 Tax=Vreelandella sedimenti TaxID=2729618 RepID=A0A7Z0NA36_9GAMM|nr:hypothetical protein [Halomonas sedimenti]NYT74395.1 hypothetical protein [Halomonas sedimenti]